MKFQESKEGVIKRREKKIVGLFIDGTGLDRATRRIKRKVDLSALVRGVTSGTKPTVARYYTLIPYEDDSRQRAFLEAVSKAGLQVIVKRLPPKGVSRQVSVDPEMAADVIAFSQGHSKFSNLSEFLPEYKSGGSSMHATESFSRTPSSRPNIPAPAAGLTQHLVDESGAPLTNGSKILMAEKRIIIVVCPSRDLSYAIALSGELGADTSNADFGHFNTGDVLKSASKWIDLSDSETIWRD